MRFYILFIVFLNIKLQLMVKICVFLKNVSKMKRECLAIFALVACLLFTCCSMNERFTTTSTLQENIESSLLIRDLECFNAELAVKQNLPRIYDVNSNTLTLSGVTRVNWRAFWMADAGGAVEGGKCGARFGSAFSPSGMIAGAVIGGLLCGAISSALEEWIEKGIEDGEPVSGFDICDAGQAFDLFCEIPSSELTTVENEIKMSSLLIDSTFQAVGIAHNVLLDRMLEEAVEEEVEEDNGISLTGLDDPIEEREGDSEPDIALSKYGVFYSEEAAQVVASEDYRANYSLHVTKRLNSQMVNDDNSMTSYIMNLFYEASMLNGGDSDDIITVANYYYSLVKDSPELSDEDKYAVCIGMAVASYSAKYWETK